MLFNVSLFKSYLTDLHEIEISNNFMNTTDFLLAHTFRTIQLNDTAVYVLSSSLNGTERIDH